MADSTLERLKDLRDTLKEAGETAGTNLPYFRPEWCKEMGEVLERHIEQQEKPKPTSCIAVGQQYVSERNNRY